MSGLSPRARELVHVGRALCQPTAADRQRIKNALRARLGAAVLPAEVLGVSVALHLRWPFAASAIVGAILFGGALLLASQHEREAAIPAGAPSVPPVETSSAVSATTERVESPIASVPRAIAPSKPATRAAPVDDSLAQEVALLSQATSDLHSGRASDALRVLDEHERKFPNGVLNEERRAARAQALCALGRRREAQRELAQLPPQSFAAAHAKQVCDAASDAER